MRRTLTWVHGGIACIVVKLTAVSVKTTFKLEELEFRSAAYAKQSIGLFPQPPGICYAHTHSMSLRDQQVDSTISKCGTKLAILIMYIFHNTIK